MHEKDKILSNDVSGSHIALHKIEFNGNFLDQYYYYARQQNFHFILRWKPISLQMSLKYSPW